MRLNRTADYMLRCVLYLAMQEPGRVVPRREIVDAMSVPDAFFRKIASQLGRAGVVEVTRGSKGGLKLARDPEALTVLEVIELAVGEITINECIFRPETCRRSPTCSVHQVLDEARDKLRSSLAGVTLAELARRESCVQELAVAGAAGAT